MKSARVKPLRKAPASQSQVVEIIDETLRDGPQSLWASRVNTETLVSIAPTVAQAGFAEMVVGSGALFEAAVKFLHEDPWERLRLIRAATPGASLRFLIRGRNLMGWRRLSNDVIDVFLECLRRAGIDSIMVFDGLNDMRNIEHHFPSAQKLGMKAVGIVCFSESPVHTDEYFAARTQDLLDAGVDAVLLYDASGVMTPERTRTLVPTLQRVIGDQGELELTAHCATGLGAECLAEGLRLGVRKIFTAGRPLAYADSIPATLDMVAHATALGLETRLDLERVREIDEYFAWIACAQEKRVPRVVTYAPDDYQRYVSHQIPGGMMSNMVRQLSDLGLEHRFPEILEEAAQVRREIGYPVMVTPLSQLVGVQATLNVVEGERYRTIPQELRMYARGYYGRPASPIEPNVLDRILQAGDAPVDPSANFAEPHLDRFRAEEGPFGSDEEMLLAVFNSRETLEEFQRKHRPVESVPKLRSPLRSLLAELGRRRGIRSMSIRTPVALSYAEAADVLASVDACPPGHRYEMQRGSFDLTIEKAQGNDHGHRA